MGGGGGLEQGRDKTTRRGGQEEEEKEEEEEEQRKQLKHSYTAEIKVRRLNCNASVTFWLLSKLHSRRNPKEP